MDGFKTPNITFKTRVKDEEGNFDWKDVTTDDYFKGKKVILFSLPGAFTPTCSTYQLPNFEKMYDDFKELGIDAIYCMSVNDSFNPSKCSAGLPNFSICGGTFKYKIQDNPIGVLVPWSCTGL